MKPSVTRTLTTPTPPEVVFDHLADFTTSERWDPGTESTERVSGDGGVGTTYRNVSTFLGRQVTVTYTAVELERPTRVHFVGRNDQFEGHDVLSLRARRDGGTEVRYHAEFSFSGATALAAPLVAAYLPVLARTTVRQLKADLDSLGGAS